MFRSKRKKRIGALTLAAVFILGCALPAAAAGDGVTPSYDEAYYATLDYYGNLVEGSVVKSYVLNGASEVVDYGVYDEVLNLSNSAAPIRLAAGKTSFDLGAAAPAHFYFQGETAKPYEEAPWTLSLTYSLNGVPVPAEALAGQKGVVEIDIDAVPNPKANAYTRQNYTLEAMALFNQDDILSLEAPGAQVQLIGNLRAVLFLALPGQTEHFEIRVGAEEFSFDGMTFLMVPATLGQLEQVAELAQNKEELEDNYRKLSGSLDALLDSLDTVSADLVSAAGGLDALNGARYTVSAGKGAVYDAADVLREDLDIVNEALAPVTEELEDASAMLTDMNAAVRALTSRTTALRGELDTLRTLLTDLRGSKADLVRIIDDLDGMQTELAALAKALNNTKINTLEKFDYPSYYEYSDVGGSLYDGLTDVNDMYSLFYAYFSRYAESGVLADAAAFASAMTYTGQMQQGAGSAAAAQAASLLGNIATAVSSTDAGTTERYNALYYIACGIVGQSLPTPMTAAEVLAAIQGGNTELAAKVTEIKASTVDIYESRAQQLVGLYTSLGGDFPGYLSGLAMMTDNSSDAAKLQELANIYAENPYLFDALDPGVAGSIGYDLVSGMDELDYEINYGIYDTEWQAVDSANKGIDKANDAITSLNNLTKPTADVVSALRTLCGHMSALKPLLDSADDLAGLAAADTVLIQDILDSVAGLQGVLDTYEPKAQETIETLDGLLGAARDTLTHTGEFADALENLMQTSGTQLDYATQQSLSSLSSSLRSVAASLDTTKDVRAAKDVLTDLVEDTWEEHTGEYDTLLMMDATAEAVSLTDARNPSPDSVQLMFRTQEIKAASDAGNGDNVIRLASDTDSADNGTFWSRLGQMFADLWAAIVGIIHIGSKEA